MTESVAITRPSAFRSKEWFAKAYALAVIAGLFPVFLSAGFWPIPAIVMFVYMVAGYAGARDSGTIFEFGDSIYYLGFTLSVGSLIAALEPFKWNARPDAVRIFHFFGLGMLTTLVGVVGRTVLQTYHRSADETLEAVNRAISEQSHAYLENLGLLARNVEQLVSNTTEEIDNKILADIKQLSSALRSCVLNVTKTQTQIERFGEQTERTVNSFQSIVEAYELLRSGVTRATEALRAQTTVMQNGVEATTSTMANFAEILGGRLGAVGTAADETSTALQTLQTRAAAFQLDAAPAQRGLNDFASAASNVAQVSSASFETIQKFAVLIDGLESAVREQSPGLQLSQLSEALLKLRAEIIALSELTSAQRTHAETLGQQSSAVVQDTAARAQSLNHTIDEIIEAVEAKLDRIV